MKILELKFKNLNSLYGEWTIDFSSPEYVSNGLFAITGPTGAGKSTIMDAICLALYGSTPRLGRITASGNEIMSRQTGECYAEVTFESQAGRFRCNWSQRRAYGRADGKLGEAKHEIAEADSGKILETKKRDVAAVIENKTGMDFGRFTRSILLAQGSFAAFLQAAPDERAPVLEQITGTEIYSDISRQVHERQRAEKAALDILQAEIAGITVLSDEDEALLQAELSQLQTSEAAILQRQAAVNEALNWQTGIDKLNQEIAVLTADQEHIQTAWDAFQPERERLQQANKAAALDGDYATLSSIRQQQQNDRESLQKNLDQLPKAKATQTELAVQLQAAEATTQQTKNERTAANPVLQQVRTLDLQLDVNLKAAASLEADCQMEQGKVEAARATREQVTTDQVTAKADLSLVTDYLDGHAKDEVLVTQLAGISAQMNSLQDIANDRLSREDQLRAARQQLDGAGALHIDRQTQFLASQNDLNSVEAKATAAREAYQSHLAGRALREYRAERDGLLREQGLLKKIAALEDERKKLVDGQPCPLCGSVEHPFAAGNIPAIDATEQQVKILDAFIAGAEKLETDIQTQESGAKDSITRLNEAQQQLSQALHQQETAAAAVERLTGELAAQIQRYDHLQGTLLSSLQPYGVTTIAPDDIKLILFNLLDRVNQWQDHQRRKTELDKRIGDLASDAARLDTLIDTIGQSLAKNQGVLVTLRQTITDQQAKRTVLFGTKDPDVEAARLETLVTAAEAAEKTAREALAQAIQQVSGIQTRIDALTESIAAREPQLLLNEVAFAESLVQVGFADETTFQSSRLPSDRRNALMQQAKTLDDQLAEIVTRRKDRERLFAQELAKQITSVSLHELSSELDSIKESYRQIGEALGAGKQKLAENMAAISRIESRQAQIEAQKLECRKWDTLHSYIGSADGKKYRNFAQGLTFELMVTHANRQLGKMTDRYLLVRDKTQPLELNVIDNYQAGEIRSTKNLSGGESFIVSLSLALGLSKMASRKVRVDSLFLDEGFGTLDEDALETALETLAGLQQDGKLIGVISHVTALKERISTQLKIWPQSGGKSRIEGPGVIFGGLTAESSR